MTGSNVSIVWYISKGLKKRSRTFSPVNPSTHSKPSVSSKFSHCSSHNVCSLPRLAHVLPSQCKRSGPTPAHFFNLNSLSLGFFSTNFCSCHSVIPTLSIMRHSRLRSLVLFRRPSSSFSTPPRKFHFVDPGDGLSQNARSTSRLRMCS